MTDELLYDVRDGIGYITFNRPKARNALTFGMYEALSKVARGVDIDGTVKALVLAGAENTAFAAGTDMSQFRAFSEPRHALDYEAVMERVLQDLEKCPVPTIAAITGACTGAGAAIAAACDLRICDTNMKFGFPIARTLGNCLSVRNMNRLTALVAQGVVAEIMLLARLLSADEALKSNLVSEVLIDGPAVRARAEELARTLSGHAPLTMKAAKEALRRLRDEGPTADDTDLITECYMSEDFRMGMEAFLAKKKPVWTGR